MSTLVVLIVNIVTKSAQLAMHFWCTQLVNINLQSLGRDQKIIFNVCCDSLDGDFETKQKILSKMIQVGPSQFSCSDCGFSTSYKNSVMNHIEAKHVGNYYFCQQCQKEFSSRVALKMHNSRTHRLWTLCLLPILNITLRVYLYIRFEFHDRRQNAEKPIWKWLVLPRLWLFES